MGNLAGAKKVSYRYLFKNNNNNNNFSLDFLFLLFYFNLFFHAFTHV